MRKPRDVVVEEHKTMHINACHVSSGNRVCFRPPRETLTKDLSASRGVLAGGPLVVGWGETSQGTPWKVLECNCSAVPVFLGAFGGSTTRHVALLADRFTRKGRSFASHPTP